MSSNIQIQRICKHCGEEFIAKTTVTQYCGDTCAKKAYKVRMRESKISASHQETFMIRTWPLSELRAKEFLTVRDLSLLLSCSIRTAYRLINTGHIKSVNISERKTLIKRSEIDKLFQ